MELIGDAGDQMDRGDVSLRRPRAHDMTLLKIVFFLIVVLPGHPPVQHHEEMATLTDCEFAVREVLEDAYGTMEDRKTSKRIIQAGCALIKEDQPT